MKTRKWVFTTIKFRGFHNQSRDSGGVGGGRGNVRSESNRRDQGERNLMGQKERRWIFVLVAHSYPFLPLSSPFLMSKTSPRAKVYRFLWGSVLWTAIQFHYCGCLGHWLQFWVAAKFDKYGGQMGPRNLS